MAEMSESAKKYLTELNKTRTRVEKLTGVKMSDAAWKQSQTSYAKALDKAKREKAAKADKPAPKPSSKTSTPKPAPKPSSTKSNSSDSSDKKLQKKSDTSLNKDMRGAIVAGAVAGAGAAAAGRSMRANQKTADRMAAQRPAGRTTPGPTSTRSRAPGRPVTQGRSADRLAASRPEGQTLRIGRPPSSAAARAAASSYRTPARGFGVGGSPSNAGRGGNAGNVSGARGNRSMMSGQGRGGGNPQLGRKN
jgi:hypothetical protein